MNRRTLFAEYRDLCRYLGVSSISRDPREWTAETLAREVAELHRLIAEYPPRIVGVR